MTTEEKTIQKNIEEAETVESVLIDTPEVDTIPTLTIQESRIPENVCGRGIGCILRSIKSGIQYGVSSFEQTFCFIVLRRPQERNRRRRNILKTVRI